MNKCTPAMVHECFAYHPLHSQPLPLTPKHIFDVMPPAVQNLTSPSCVGALVPSSLLSTSGALQVDAHRRVCCT